MEHFSAAPVFVGIDVAKNRLDVHLRPSGEALAVGRDAAGLNLLVERLAELAPALVVLEATGGFEVTVAAALGAAQLPLAVVNPRQIRDFARAMAASPRPIGSTPRRSRASPRPPARATAATRRGGPRARRAGRPPPPARRDDHEPRASADRQRRDPRLASERLRRAPGLAERELSAIETDLDDAVRGSAAWRATEDLLASVPGSGKTSARTLIAGLPELGSLDRRKIAEPRRPRPVQSRQRRLGVAGASSWRPRRASGEGPVHADPHRHPPQSRHPRPLRAPHRRGKPAKVAITAAMRTLLTILNAILKKARLHGNTLDPSSTVAFAK